MIQIAKWIYLATEYGVCISLSSTWQKIRITIWKKEEYTHHVLLLNMEYEYGYAPYFWNMEL